jgi:hypothetical protein
VGRRPRRRCRRRGDAGRARRPTPSPSPGQESTIALERISEEFGAGGGATAQVVVRAPTGVDGDRARGRRRRRQLVGELVAAAGRRVGHGPVRHEGADGSTATRRPRSRERGPIVQQEAQHTHESARAASEHEHEQDERQADDEHECRRQRRVEVSGHVDADGGGAGDGGLDALEVGELGAQVGDEVLGRLGGRDRTRDDAQQRARRSGLGTGR